MARHTIEVVVRGRPGSDLLDGLGEFDVRTREDGTTSLTGTVADQAALLGLLALFDDLHVEVVSVNRVGDVADDSSRTPPPIPSS